LDTLLWNLSTTLKQVEDIVQRYYSLGRAPKTTWDRVKFATKDLVDVRTKLQFHINGINLFIASLSAGSLARIELVLDELVRDVKAGRKESTIASTYEDNDEISWDELERELVGDGITREDVKQYKEEIRDCLRRLMEDNICSIAEIEPADSVSLAGGLDEPQVSDQCDNAVLAIEAIDVASTPDPPSRKAVLANAAIEEAKRRLKQYAQDRRAFELRYRK
jgi:hypothetical protein